MSASLPPLPDRPDVAELAAGYLDGSLGESETARLNALLADDAEARRMFVAMTVQSRWISETFADRIHEGTPAARGGSAATVSTRRIGRIAFALAAALLAGAAGIAVYLGTFDRDGANGDAPSSPTLATVTDLDGVAWSGEPLNTGDEVADRTVSIGAGAVELTMHGGGDVRLVGSTAVRLTGRARVHLERGTIDVRSKPGFAVTLARGVEVVDLGTEFTVNAYADGRSAVSVREGRVRVRDSSGTERTLGAGLVAAIDDAGRLTGARSGGPFDNDPRLVAMYRFTGDDARAGVLTNHAIRREGRFAATLGDGVNPATTPAWVDGPTAGGRALRIASAASQQVRIAGFADAGIDKAITIAAWVKLDRAAAWQIIAAQWDIGPQRRGFIHLSIRNGRLALHWVEDERTVTSIGNVRELIAGEAGAIAPADGWVHVAMALRAGGEIALYRNGGEVARGRYESGRFPAAAHTPLVFGHKSGAEGPGFDGSIGPIAVFDAALSPIDVERLYGSSSAASRSRVKPADHENENR